jgi:Arc/MetJ family transcription regulator
MRTNVVLNDELVEEAMQYSNARSKSALIEEALRFFVESRAARRRRTNYERRLRALRGELDELVLRQSSVDLVRKDRERG